MAACGWLDGGPAAQMEESARMFDDPERRAEAERQIRQAAVDRQYAENDTKVPRPPDVALTPARYVLGILVVLLIVAVILGGYLLTHR